MNGNEEKKNTDYTGVIIGALLLPVVILSIRLRQESLGRSVCVSLAALMLSIRIRWDLRRRLWFWGVIALWMALHIPLLLYVHWPHGWIPAIVMLPVAIVDCWCFLGTIQFLEALINSDRSKSGPVG